MKTMLDNQQKVNEAVKEITDYFMHVTYEDDLELMFSALLCTSPTRTTWN